MLRLVTAAILTVIVGIAVDSTPVLAQPCFEYIVPFLQDDCIPEGVQGGSIFGDSTLCGATDDFDPGPGNPCTGRAVPGPDLHLTYEVTGGVSPCHLVAILDYCPDGPAFDGAIYALVDCGLPTAQCVAGSDNPGVGVPEFIDAYVGLRDERISLVVDSQTSTCGRFSLAVSIECPIASTESRGLATPESVFPVGDPNSSAPGPSATGSKTRSSGRPARVAPTEHMSDLT